MKIQLADDKDEACKEPERDKYIHRKTILETKPEPGLLSGMGADTSRERLIFQSRVPKMRHLCCFRLYTESSSSIIN